MKTAEEFINSKGYTGLGIHGGIFRYSKDGKSETIFELMEQYAKENREQYAKQEAIEFARWLEIKINEYNKVPPDDRPNWVYKTYFDEAYDQFKESKEVKK